MAKKETVLVFGAHNDDHIIGMGGTIARYLKEGSEVIVRIFSYGELSHPHLKGEVITKTRVLESKKADKILGLKDVKYLGVKETQFSEFLDRSETRERIKETIQKTKPLKIFTHAPDDPHPIHRSVHKLIIEIVEELNSKVPVYSFDVWNIVKTKRSFPKIVVDVTDTFKKKIDALTAHKSQKMTIISLVWQIYLKDRFNGWKNSSKYAEVFYKIR